MQKIIFMGMLIAFLTSMQFARAAFPVVEDFLNTVVGLALYLLLVAGFSTYFFCFRSQGSRDAKSLNSDLDK